MGLPDPPRMESVVHEVGRSDLRWRSDDWNDVRHFVRAVVRELRRTDTNWGLNYKRGGPEISADVIAYYYGPTDRDGRLVDIVGGATGPNPLLYWGLIEDDGTRNQRWTLDTINEGVRPGPMPQPTPSAPLPTPAPIDLSVVYGKLEVLITRQQESHQAMLALEDRLRIQIADVAHEITVVQERAGLAASSAFEARNHAYDAKIEALNAAVRVLAIASHLGIQTEG